MKCTASSSQNLQYKGTVEDDQDSSPTPLSPKEEASKKAKCIIDRLTVVTRVGLDCLYAKHFMWYLEESLTLILH